MLNICSLAGVILRGKPGSGVILRENPEMVLFFMENPDFTWKALFTPGLYVFE